MRQITRNYSAKQKKKGKMPPKKVVKEEKILLGRPGNSLKSGIVCTQHSTITDGHESVEHWLTSLTGWTGQCRKVYSIPSYH